MPVLDEIDAQRGPQALYSAHELEAAILFQRAGERGYRAARATISRWKTKFFPQERRAEVYGQLVAELRQRVAPMLDNSRRLLYIDGTKIETHCTAPSTTRAPARSSTRPGSPHPTLATCRPAPIPIRRATAGTSSRS